MPKKGVVSTIGFILFLCSVAPSLYSVQNDENDSTYAYMSIVFATIGGVLIFYGEHQDARKDNYVWFNVGGFVCHALAIAFMYSSFQTWHPEDDDRRLRRLRGRRLHSLQ